MRNFFLVLSEEQQRRLQAAGVESCHLNIDGRTGEVVDQDNLQSALSALGVAVAGEYETPLEGIVRVELRPREGQEDSSSYSSPLPQNEVEVRSFNSERSNASDYFKKVVEDILLPAIQQDAVLDVPHGKSREPANDGLFWIWIWSGILPKRDGQAPSKIWGIPVSCRDAGFQPSGQGVPIVDPETGYAVAELVENNLLIHHDICHHGSRDELSIFRRLLEEVVTEISATPEEKAERQRKLAEERLRRSREQYIQECSRRFEKTVKGTRDKISSGKTEIEKLQQQLSRKIREVSGAERKLEQMEKTRDGQLESYGREFDSLTAVPGVEDVQVADGVIKVFTENIEITPDGHDVTFDIGKFRMEVYTSGTNGGIRFFNITRKGAGGYNNYNIHHPHVSSEGIPCLGNIGEIVPQLIGEYEYSAVAQLGLQFLKTVNLDDSAGRGIFDAWPRKEETDG